MNSIRFPICILVTLLSVFSGWSAQHDDSGFPPWIREMRAELKKLPSEALLDMLRSSKLPAELKPGAKAVPQNSPESVRLSQALIILEERGLGIEEIKALLDMIKANDCAVLPELMSSISRPAYTSMATPSELAVVDELLKQLPPMLDQKAPGSPDVYVVMAIQRLIHHSDAVMRANENVWPEVPYRNKEVLEILVKALSDARFGVREEAARSLGSVGANDPNLAPGVIKALEHQIEAEGRGDPNLTPEAIDRQTKLLEEEGLAPKYDESKANAIKTMMNAKDKIGKKIQQYKEKGGQVVEPDDWPPKASSSRPQTSDRK